MTHWVKSIWLLRILSIRKRALRICSVAFELNHPADLTGKIFNPWNIETNTSPSDGHVTVIMARDLIRISSNFPSQLQAFSAFRLFVGISDFRPELRNVIKKSSISIKFVKNMSRISISRFYKFVVEVENEIRNEYSSIIDGIWDNKLKRNPSIIIS